jgi:alpha-tubulin suppressor-like RCC1 family protein
VLNGTGTGPLTGIAGISAGHNHLCFRLTNGQVRCTGVNADGQLGDRTTTGRPGVVSMVNVAGTANMTGVAAVTAGEKHTCVRFTNGQLACTGANGSGQLGDGTGQGTARPVGVRRN